MTVRDAQPIGSRPESMGTPCITGKDYLDMKISFVTLFATLVATTVGQSSINEATSIARSIHGLLGSRFKFEELESMVSSTAGIPSYSFMQQNKKTQYFESILIFNGNITASITSTDSRGSDSKQTIHTTKELSNLARSLNADFKVIPPKSKSVEKWNRGARIEYVLEETPWGYSYSGNRNMIRLAVDSKSGKLATVKISTGFKAVAPSKNMLGVAKLLKIVQSHNPNAVQGKLMYSWVVGANGMGVPEKECRLYYFGFTRTGSEIQLDPVTGKVVFDSRTRRSRK